MRNMLSSKTTEVDKTGLHHTLQTPGSTLFAAMVAVKCYSDL